MKTIGVAVILFLMGFFTEFLLLCLDGEHKLLALTPPSIAGMLFLAGGGGPCGMPQLAILILMSPALVGIAAAVVLRLLIWLLKDEEE